MRSFLRCSISNSLDGTKGDIVYENSAESSADKLDDSFVQELFTSDDEESDFEEFVNRM